MVPGKPYILEANIKNIQLENVLLQSTISGTHPFLWINVWFYLKDGMSVRYMTRIELKGVGNTVGNSSLGQGFRGDLVLIKVNLNTHSSYFLGSLSVFPGNYQKSAH